MKHPSKHLSLSKDFQPNPSPDTPSGGTEVDTEKMRQAQIRLRDIIFGSSGQDASNKDEDDETEKMGNRPGHRHVPEHQPEEVLPDAQRTVHGQCQSAGGKTLQRKLRENLQLHPGPSSRTRTV